MNKVQTTKILIFLKKTNEEELERTLLTEPKHSPELCSQCLIPSEPESLTTFFFWFLFVRIFSLRHCFSIWLPFEGSISEGSEFCFDKICSCLDGNLLKFKVNLK